MPCLFLESVSQICAPHAGAQSDAPSHPHARSLDPRCAMGIKSSWGSKLSRTSNSIPKGSITVPCFFSSAVRDRCHWSSL